MKTRFFRSVSRSFAEFWQVLVLMFGLVGIVSCAPSGAENEIVEPHTISVSFSGFGISSVPMTRATDVIPENLNRLALKVFDTEGGVVQTIQQKKADTGFGTVQLTLAPGTYTFVCVLNEAVAADVAALADIAAANIVSSTEARIPGWFAHDAFTCVKTVDITSSTTSVSIDMGNRINARFRLKVTDTAPDAVKAVRFTISPNASSPSTDYLTINPTTGRATSEVKYIAQKANITNTVPEFEIDLYIPSNPFTTEVKLEGRDASSSNSKVLYTRTVTGVQFVPNNITIATGKLFDPATVAGSFTFTNADWTTSDVSF